MIKCPEVYSDSLRWSNISFYRRIVLISRPYSKDKRGEGKLLIKWSLPFISNVIFVLHIYTNQWSSNNFLFGLTSLT